MVNNEELINLALTEWKKPSEKIVYKNVENIDIILLSEGIFEFSLDRNTYRNPDPIKLEKKLFELLDKKKEEEENRCLVEILSIDEFSYKGECGTWALFENQLSLLWEGHVLLETIYGVETDEDLAWAIEDTIIRKA